MKKLARFIKPALFVSALCGTVILFSLPTVLYYIALYTDFWNHFSTIKPLLISSTVSEGNKTLSGVLDNQTSCAGAIPWGISDANSYTDVVCESYSGDVCLQYLREWQECIPLPAGSLNIAIDRTIMKSQKEREQDIVQFQDVLESYGFNDCRDLAIPMLCHYYFPLMASNDCSTSSQQTSTVPVYMVTQEDCNNIDNTVCATPWLIANTIENIVNNLPDCSTLPSKDGNYSQRAVNDSINSLIEYNTTSSTSNITCRDDFILINQLCIPRCNRFTTNSRKNTLARSSGQYIGNGISVLFSVTAFILSVINRKVMFRFPSFFLILMVIDVFFIAMMTLIRAFDTETLYCSSVNLIESLFNPTPYCVFSGVVNQYVLANMFLWWFFHLCMLFYSVKFPFHARRMKELNKTKKLATVLVILGFTVPLPGVIAAFTSKRGARKYNFYSFPPEGCLPSNIEMAFYSMSFILSIIFCIGVCLLISIFWIIHKNQQQTSPHDKNIKKLTTTEKKLIVALLCYIVFGTYSLILFGVALGDAGRARKGITEYILCELPGHVPGKCDRSAFERHHYPVMFTIGYITLGLIPTGVIVFIVSWHNLWKSFKDQFKSFKQSSTGVTES